ncbi:MAG: helix-turn-helix domain-containing protein [Nitrososphaeria archaeon]
MDGLSAIELYRNGLSVSQISKTLKVSAATVYKRLHAADLLPKRTRKKVDLQPIITMLELNGFAKVSNLGTGRKLERSIPGSRLVTISFGVGSVGRKYSSTEFFGFRPPNMHFLVKDYEMYRQHVSRFVEGIFLEHNERATRGMRRAFTHFLNLYGLQKTGGHQ